MEWIVDSLWWAFHSFGQVLLYLSSIDFLIFATVAGIAANLNWTEENKHLCYTYACLSALSGAVFYLFVGWVNARKAIELGDTTLITDMLIFCEKIIPQVINGYLMYRLGQARNVFYRLACIPILICIVYTLLMPMEKLVSGTIHVYNFAMNNWAGKYLITVLSSIEVILLLVGSDSVRDTFKRHFNNGQAANGRVLATKRSGVVQDTSDSRVRDSDSISH